MKAHKIAIMSLIPLLFGPASMAEIFTTKSLLLSCENKKEDNDRCHAYIEGFMHGRNAGFMERHLLSAFVSEANPAKICLNEAESLNGMIEKFVEWGLKVAPHERESFLTLPASQGFYSFLSWQYKC